MQTIFEIDRVRDDSKISTIRETIQARFKFHLPFPRKNERIRSPTADQNWRMKFPIFHFYYYSPNDLFAKVNMIFTFQFYAWVFNTTRTFTHRIREKSRVSTAWKLGEPKTPIFNSKPPKKRTIFVSLTIGFSKMTSKCDSYGDGFQIRAAR